MKNHSVIKINERELPRPLTSSPEFMGLDGIRQENFISRMRYIEEISLKIDQWAFSVVEKNDDVRTFIDEIELDLMVNLGTPGNTQVYVSPWLIHSSWTFETSARAMRTALGVELLALLHRSPIGIDATVEEFSTWIAALGKSLVSLLDRFFLSSSFDEVMGSLVAIDLCLAQLYCGFIAQRLNPRLLQI